MHHPGPPRFLAVGESTELAPRDPDPSGTYTWRIEDAPDGSYAVLGDDPVETFVPDVPGVYTVALAAPDGTHELTLRVFPADMAIDEEVAQPATSGQSGASGISGRSGMSGYGERSGSGIGSGLGRPEPGEARPRLTLDAERDGDKIVLQARPQTEPHRGAPPTDLDVEFYVDDRDELAGHTIEGQKFRIPIDAIDEAARVHAIAVGDQYSVPDSVRIDGDGAIERLNDPPAWSTEMTLYEIYVRGYVDPDPGQTVFGAIAEKLDHIQDLGVDTLWFTPVLQHDGNEHGYNITDFFSIADDLGGEEAFRELVAEAHDRDMRVLFDLVLNHSARDHEFYQRALAGDEQYLEWYDWEDREAREPETYFDWELIANFDYENLEVRRHLLDAVEKWAGVVDGFRCDMAWAVPQPFWQEIRETVTEIDDDFLLMDETIPYVADFHNLCFDVHFDAGLYFDLLQIGHGDQPGEALFGSLESRYQIGFPDHAGFLTYIENHDEERYVSEVGHHAVRAAATATFTLPGIPMIYAGQEIGERQRRGETHWGHTDEDLLDFYQRLSRTREAIEALGGDAEFEPVETDADSEQVVAYARENDDRYVVVLNFGHEAVEVGLPGETVEPVDELADETVAAEGGVHVENAVILQAA
ncbi:alpha-amylase family glycosyl hydrolase [Halorhabdus rudnickae]|uniref:alpha-amylase family glycosyl hydrolase n=1 Tax=Halorhabdus rudnickae TaxID=1775544 RepID=UPI001AEF5394|nr:alpha-amylase family glycosyl hydrolase [Halorhabdus rudnickae]